MLRFRPIAPKPAAEDPGQGGSHVGSKGWLLSGARTKRKYVRVRKAKANSNCSGNNNHDSSSTTKRKRAAQGPKEKGGPDDSSGLEKRIVTLQLLPEKADHGESKALKAKPEQSEKEEPQWRGSIDRCSTHSGPEFSTVNLAIPNVVPPLWSRSDPIGLIHPTFQSPHRMRYPTVLECWVIVESVADTHIDAQDHHQLVGLTDAERVRSLKADACPGFLADPSNRVRWVNGAFERMVTREHLADDGSDGGPLPVEIAVRVVAKEELPKTRAAFACRATLRRRHHPWWGEEKWAARIVPCDVWRMDEMGGFAWRLDVKAALSLGLS
ncbi:uncharacterized protein LOC104419161 [Eucalyptus grandis]|uniref:uncharacterized protein LOC104419161 n=1 Tax=Eucalyptus grandis TaxID=71139 RepID=UPI00192EA44F|nr:uncharacterized protein LOC104419161 [Eucalyptus grandis]